jgi:hypothetical protein
VFTGNSSSYGAAIEATNRLLNSYARNVELFYCPSDKGDGLTPEVKSSYEAWGNS